MKGGGSLGGSFGVLVDVLSSMPKGEIVGNIFIDGKGTERRNTKIIIDGKEGEKQQQ